MTKPVLPNSEDSQSFRRQPVEKLLLDLFVLGHLLHMGAIDNDVGHLENAVLLFHRAHNGGRHEHLGRAHFNAPAHLFEAAALVPAYARTLSTGRSFQSGYRFFASWAPPLVVNTLDCKLAS